MEVVGGVASIVTIVELTKEIVLWCGKYLHDVQHACHDIQRIQAKASALETVLLKLKDKFTNGPLSKSEVGEAPFQQCSKDLSSINDRLNPQNQKSRMRRFGLRALKWPLTNDEVKKEIHNLESWVTIFSTLLTYEISDKVGDAEQDRCLEKLLHVHDAPFDSYVNEQRHRSCLEQTRADVLKEIMNWSISSPQCVFWLQGQAGIGKSTVAVTVASRLKSQFKSFASYFLKRGLGDLAHVKKLIPTLAWQLSQRSVHYRKLIVAAIKKRQTLGSRRIFVNNMKHC